MDPFVENNVPVVAGKMPFDFLNNIPLMNKMHIAKWVYSCLDLFESYMSTTHDNTNGICKYNLHIKQPKDKQLSGRASTST